MSLVPYLHEGLVCIVWVYNVLQDIHLADLDDLRYGGTNITGFRMMSPQSAAVEEVWSNLLYEESRGTSKILQDFRTLPVTRIPV